MLTTFEGKSANEVWVRAYNSLTKNGFTQSSRAGETKEILHAALSISDPKQRWIHSRFPAINTAFAIAEIVWILAGRNDRRFLSFWSKSLSGFVGTARSLHGAYGHRLAHHFGFDQMARASQILESKPDSRQLVLQIWDPTTDMPFKSGRPRNKDIPCNVLSMLKIRNGTLEWMQIMRSNDLFRGLPYNLVQFTSLQEIIAGWIGVKPGTFNQVSDSLHVYTRDLKSISVGSGIIPINNDTLALSRIRSKAAISSLSSFIEHIIDGISQIDLAYRIRNQDLPNAYRNLQLILAAEACRKRGWHDLAYEAYGMCTNPALTASWKNWAARCGAPTF